MMKILVLTTKPPWPPHDGGAVATMKCINGFLENNAVVSVLSIKTQKHLKSSDAGKSTIDQLLSYDSVFLNTSVKPLAALGNLLFSHEPYDLARFQSDDFNKKLIETLRSERFDIIQCEGLVFSLYVDLIRANCTSPVVLRAHNLEHRIRGMMAEQSGNILVRYYLSNLAERVKEKEIKATRQFDALIPISENDRQWFASVNPRKPINLTVSGVDINSLSYPAETAGYNVGFIGALDWEPNISGLFWFLKKVWPRITDQIPSATLHIAGRNAPARLTRMLTGYNVYFIGEPDDAAEFTSGMNLMISPLFIGSGLRIKILEAMSRGRVVVCTHQAAIGIPVTHRKDILIANDEVNFALEVIKALNNPAMREKIAGEAINLLRRSFDNRRVTADLLKFYKSFLNGR